MVTMESFAQAFGFDAKSDDVWTTLGKVNAVNQDGTLSVKLGGSATPTTCEAYCTARAGDIVFVVISKGRARAVACKGGDGNGKYLPLAGGTLTGALSGTSASFSGNVTISKVDAGLSLKCTDTSGQIGQTIPTGSNKRLAGEYMYDKDSRNIYYSEMIKTTADDLYRSFVVARRDAADSATKLNGFYLHINSSGNPTVSFTSGGAAAWRDGLGLGAAATMNTGTTATTVALGNHTHAASAIASGTLDVERLSSARTHRTSHGNIDASTTAPTAAAVGSWNYDKYSDGLVHAWGIIRIQNQGITTSLGTGFYWNSTAMYVALPVKAKFIMSVQYGYSMGGSQGAGAYLMSTGSTSDWSSGGMFYLRFNMARPVSGSSGTYWFPVDVWYMAA